MTRRYAAIPVPIGAALLAAVLCAGNAPALAADGEAVFSHICANCHQSHAEGAVGLAPPLAGTLGARLASDTGRRYLAGVLLFGLAGKIESNGASYNGIMPSWAALGDEDLAAVANHVLTTFNAASLPPGFKPYTPDEFAALRAQKPTRATLRSWRAESGPAATR